MVDNLSREQRKKNMAAIKSRNTKPEKTVRSLIHRMGYRFRLHCKSLPGKPDIVLPKHRKIVFVHGCFWHSHDCKYGLVSPKTNVCYWEEKRLKNKVKDSENLDELRKQGWSVLIIWECKLKDKADLEENLQSFLSL